MTGLNNPFVIGAIWLLASLIAIAVMLFHHVNPIIIVLTFVIGLLPLAMMVAVLYCALRSQ